MYQDGQVENMIISFYVNKETFKKTSFMKFGSYDTAGFDMNHDYFSMKTESNTSWAVDMISTGYFSYVVYNSETAQDFTFNVPNNENRKFLFDPAFPFIYMPQKDLTALVDAIANA